MTLRAWPEQIAVCSVLATELADARFLLAESQCCASLSEAAERGFLAFLLREQGALSLRDCNNLQQGGVQVDFVSGRMGFRASAERARHEMVVKACAVQKLSSPLIWDLTAGLGRDSWLLAMAGARVRMFERHPVIHALLRDGLQRAQTEPSVADAARRMQLCHLDSHLALLQPDIVQGVASGAVDVPDVILIDPMFPHEGRKKAQVKKDMQLFRQLLAGDSDADSLLQPALLRARHRVVVKRALRTPFLAERAPQISLTGKSHRFDIYPVKASL